MKLAQLLTALAPLPLLAAASGPGVAYNIFATSSSVPFFSQAVNANGGSFWVRKLTGGGITETAFVGGSPTVGLDVSASGGQSVYVESNGLLAYSAPGVAPPAGSTLTGFTWSGISSEGDLGFSGLGGNAFVACPVDPSLGTFQIFVNVAGGNWTACSVLRMLTTESRFGNSPVTSAYP